MKRFLLATAVFLSALAGSGSAHAAASCALFAPPDGFEPPARFPIAAGVAYRAVVVLCPRDLAGSGPETLTMAHVVEVDLKTPGVSVRTSSPTSEKPSCTGAGPCFTVALPSKAVSADAPLDGPRQPVPQVAVNANLFLNCCTADAPTTQTALRGLEVEGGTVNTRPLANADFSPPTPPPAATFASSLLISKSGTASIWTASHDKPGQPDDVATAVTGSHQIVEAGRNRVATCGLEGCSGWLGLNARTAVGLRDSTALLVAVIDGEDGGHSGVTLYQVGDVMRQLGAKDAINLDGGGSSAMARRDGSRGFVMLSKLADDPGFPAHSTDTCTVPAGAKIDCERYVGNVLTVLAPPLAP